MALVFYAFGKWSFFLVLTLRLFSPSSILCRFRFSVSDATKFRSFSAVILQCSAKTLIKCSVTSTDELLSLIDEVRGHFIVAHKLLKAQEVQTTGTQAVKKKKRRLTQPH